MENLIKVVNPIKAEELRQMGFSYMLENSGEKIFYVFTPTDELLSHVKNTFSKEDYLCEKRLRF